MEEKKKETEQNDLKERLDIDGRSTDWYLQYLVGLVNQYGMEMGITITVEGLVISGTLTSGKNYFEQFAKDISQGWNGIDPETREEMRMNFAGYSKIYEESDSGEPPPPPQYLHLRDARFYSPTGKGSIPSSGPGVLWRGKINAVSGFTLGSFSSNSQG